MRVDLPVPVAHAAGTGCLVLFLLPFAATGTFTVVRALGLAASGDWGAAAGLGLFGLTFGLVGFGGIVAALRARRSAADLLATRARHPDAPWMWREDWAAGRIEDGNRGSMIGAWFFAGFWNVVSLPATFFAVRQALRDGEPGPLVVLIFPAVGLGLLVWAVRATIRYRRFGISRLELSSTPVPLGRELRGTVTAPALIEAREGLRVTLTCLRRVTRGSGKNRSTSETVLWQEEQHVTPGTSRTTEGMVTSVPVAFRVPADAQPTDATNPRDRILWRLALTAEVPGVDYGSSFEVPVFRTSESAATEDIAAPAAPPVPFVQPPTSKVKVSRNRRGTEIVFPAGRNPGASAGIAGFLAVWLVAVWATIRFDAPLLLQLVFGGFGVLLGWIALASWFGVSQVTVGDGTVTVARGLFAAMREQRMPAGEVAQVVTRIGMQAGGTPYYDLILVRSDGREVPAGRGIRDKREAEWLADTVRGALKG